MKKIGLVGGMSWVSTVDYYRLINQGVNDRIGGLNFAECIIYSLNFGDIQIVNWNNSFELLYRACLSLKNSGAECIVLCANTAHQFIEQLEAKIELPFINIVSETARIIEGKRLTKVGLLGTKYTMEMDFFKDGLMQKGIECIIPKSESTREFIQLTLRDELGKGICKSKTKEAYLSIINELMKDGAQGIVLGCTELPLIVSQQDVSVPLIDTLTLHCEAIIKFALIHRPAQIL